MGRSFTLVQTVTTAGVFSAVSYWYSSTFLSSVNQLFFYLILFLGVAGMVSCLEENQLGKSLET